MPEQPPPDDQPTTPDAFGDGQRPEEQTVPLAPHNHAPSAPMAPVGPAAGYAAPSAPAPPQQPRRTYQVSRGMIAGAAAAVLLVGGLAGYAIGATVVAAGSDHDGPMRVDWRGDTDGPGRGGGSQQGPQGGFGGPWSGPQGGYGGPWSGPGWPQDSGPQDAPPSQGEGGQQQDGGGDSQDDGSGT